MGVIMQLSVSNETVKLSPGEDTRLSALVTHAKGVALNTYGSFWIMNRLIVGQVDMIFPTSFDPYSYPHSEPDIIGFERVKKTGKDVILVRSHFQRDGFAQFAALVVTDGTIEPLQQVWLAKPETTDETTVRQIIDFLNNT